jgi:hypothetical protein
MHPTFLRESPRNPFHRGTLFVLKFSGQSSIPPPAAGPGMEGAPSTGGVPSGKPTTLRGTPVYIGVGVAIVVVMVVLAYLLTGGFHAASKGSSGSNGTVLIPRGTGYSYVIGQFNGIVFSITSESRIQGELNSSRGIAIYIFTTAEFQYLVRNLTVGQYVWASGVVADQTIYDLNVLVQPGQWVLSFVNPNVSWPTGVGFYSDVVLTPM